jgi:hypothetical protein
LLSIESVPEPAMFEVAESVPVIAVLLFRYTRPSTEREPEPATFPTTFRVDPSEVAPSIDRTPEPEVFPVVFKFPVMTVFAFRYVSPSTERTPEDVRRSCAWSVNPDDVPVISSDVPENVFERLKTVPARVKPWPGV